jgi:hypothetical protein
MSCDDDLDAIHDADVRRARDFGLRFFFVEIDAIWAPTLAPSEISSSS